MVFYYLFYHSRDNVLDNITDNEVNHKLVASSTEDPYKHLQFLISLILTLALGNAAMDSVLLVKKAKIKEIKQNN